MTITVCNVCGLPIDDPAAAISINVGVPIGRVDMPNKQWKALRRIDRDAATRHYHAFPLPGATESCFKQVSHALSAAESFGSLLESIPVATDAEIAALRPFGHSVVESATAQQRSAPRSPKKRRSQNPDGAAKVAAIWATLAPDGTRSAGLGFKPAIYSALAAHGIVTLAELEKRHADGSLVDVPGIGAKRLAIIDEALSRRGATA